MALKKTTRIRQLIASAQQHERETHQLESYLADLIPTLHNAIALPVENPTGALLQFVMSYIEHAPDFLEALEEAMQYNGIAFCGEIFIEIAQDFFLQPPDIAQHDGGLRAMINEAYLAHRLIEELNDRLLTLCGAPLVPMDMTMANIVVHQLLGEEFANQLDLAVHYAIEALLQPETFKKDVVTLASQSSGGEWSDSFQSRPCLVEQSSIRLHFSNALEKATEH